MYHKRRPLDGGDQGGLVCEVSLDEFQVGELLTESLADGGELSLVVLVTDGASDAEAAVLEEHLGGHSSDISGDTSEGDNRFISLGHLAINSVKDIFDKPKI